MVFGKNVEDQIMWLRKDIQNNPSLELTIELTEQHDKPLPFFHIHTSTKPNTYTRITGKFPQAALGFVTAREAEKWGFPYYRLVDNTNEFYTVETFDTAITLQRAKIKIVERANSIARYIAEQTKLPLRRTYEAGGQYQLPSLLQS